MKKLHKSDMTQSITSSIAIILQGKSQIFHYFKGLAQWFEEICSKKIGTAVRRT